MQLHCRTEKFKNSFIPDCIAKWNSLDDTIKAITDYDHFKAVICKPTNGNPLYYYGKRNANIIHSQLRMHCSNLKGHLVELHVLDDPICICSTGIEDTKHFLLQCPLYHACRTKMMNTVSLIGNFTCETLLYGENELSLDDNCIIFEAVHAFIIESGRFA